MSDCLRLKLVEFALNMTIEDPSHDRAQDSLFDAERQIVRQALHREGAAEDEILAYLLPMERGPNSAVPFASVILAVGLPPRDTLSHRTARCQLALALETLAKAQRIHRLKMVVEPPPDSYLAGSAVLLGDHHFARAAQLVTQLGNPALLEAFAHVLKMASTQEVASLVAESCQELRTRAAITTFGIKCGAFLADILPAEVTRTVAAWRRLATSPHFVSPETAVANFLAEVPKHQKERWRVAASEYLDWPSGDSF